MGKFISLWKRACQVFAPYHGFLQILKTNYVSMEVVSFWRLKQQMYALIGEVCPKCDAKIFPPKAVCPHCSGDRIINAIKGDVYCYTMLLTETSLPMEVSMSSKQQDCT